MYEAEVHGSVEQVGLLEKLDFDLDISEERYQKEYDIEGELRTISKPTNEVIENRESSPTNFVDLAGQALGLSLYENEGFPGTKMYVGVNRVTPLTRDDAEFRDEVFSEALTLEGLPENGTIATEVDWDLEEARDYQADDGRKVISTPYDLSDYPSELLPIVVRGEFYQDIYEHARNLLIREQDEKPSNEGADDEELALEPLKGQSALAIELDVRQDLAATYQQNTSPSVTISNFELKMDSTFPNLDFTPDPVTYDPDQRRVEWGTAHISAGQTEEYWLTGPANELMNLGTISAKIRGKIPDFTVSGARIDGVYDASGNEFPAEAAPALDVQTNFTASVDLDAAALRGEGQKITEATVKVAQDPDQVFDTLKKVCQQNGIEIQYQEKPGEGIPMVGRDGVWEVNTGEGNHGELRGRRDYNERGIVYGHFTVEGLYTASSEQQEVSAFDESEDRIVRADEGGLETSGKTTVSIRARSADSDLNTEFIGIIEQAFEGREY